MSELQPCPFCGGTKIEEYESTYWTGQRSKLIYASIRHWCDNKPHGGFIELKAPSLDDAYELWNASPLEKADV